MPVIAKTINALLNKICVFQDILCKMPPQVQGTKKLKLKTAIK